jgi:hypothetical protein
MILFKRLEYKKYVNIAEKETTASKLFWDKAYKLETIDSVIGVV